MEEPRIIFTGGGTLGPVTPLIAVIRAVRASAPGAAIDWIGTKGGPEERMVRAAGIPYHGVSSGKLRRYWSWSNLTDPLRIARGFFESRALLKSLRADAVVSAGGFVAVPVAWAARSLGIPVHVHQQDVRPGLANRLSLPAASSMSVTLERSLADFPRRDPVWTGNPVRPEVFQGSRDEARRIFGLEDGVPTVLVLGGGTGAAGLNRLVWGSLPALTPVVQVIHAAGPGKIDPSVSSPHYHQFELLTSELPHAYAAADLVVTRAGMGALTELAALGKPAIIVPMPGSHQEDNARAFGEGAGTVVLDERRSTAKDLCDAVFGLAGIPSLRRTMGERMKGMNKPGAAEAIAAIALEKARLHARARGH
ncbi:MAG TPA: UDP-N-acetylglucosamine--N-acetylmuramyl-(pentapeptide) pyrophosphoryl-undecaprenol N-acetylglucosamine transferase [Candidatus Eisenbacteria bacterium]|nr:UDP-N-acetylglucosamine--N-acetylmuramyl-(pentapeptide) pyrophosphoryl-undecaprenol N-acetylglucosamine transferase [Candidatus Eisenbacteria bacterium]